MTTSQRLKVGLNACGTASTHRSLRYSHLSRTNRPRGSAGSGESAHPPASSGHGGARHPQSGLGKIITPF
jgi:hypothetical protein